MKCQHCGINFDDGEKTCPVCGARAGSRGRLSEPRKFPFQPKTVRPKAKERTEYESVQSEIDPEYESVRTTAQHQSHSHEAQPLGRKARPSAKPVSRAAEQPPSWSRRLFSCSILRRRSSAL